MPSVSSSSKGGSQLKVFTSEQRAMNTTLKTLIWVRDNSHSVKERDAASEAIDGLLGAYVALGLQYDAKIEAAQQPA